MIPHLKHIDPDYEKPILDTVHDLIDMVNLMTKAMNLVIDAVNEITDDNDGPFKPL